MPRRTRRIARRNLSAFHQGVERLAGGVSIAVQAGQLAPAAVGALLRGSIPPRASSARPDSRQPTRDRAVDGPVLRWFPRGLFSQPRPRALHARLQFLPPRRDAVGLDRMQRPAPWR